MREFRQNHPLTEEQKKKDTARSYAGVYKKRGLINKKPCEICSNTKVEMHHNSYDAPTVIVWLCRKCHLLVHRIFDRVFEELRMRGVMD